MHYDGGTILAIDAASQCGLAYGEPGSTPVLESIALRKDETDDEVDIFGRAHMLIYKRLEEADLPTLIVIERPIPSSKIKNNKTTDAGQMILKGIYAIFAGAARAHCIPVWPANIQKWRKYSLGAGNLTTADAKRKSVALCKHLGWHAIDDNAADAAGIWLWACSIAAPTIAMPVPIFAKMSVDEYRAIKGRAG